ncbi:MULTISPECIES: SigE family RNA polymerase sigma factor [Streptomyces]|uniref:DNA-directed RNA polymerase sigma-70 factor n=2 Tax=Streptomyces TaxID=1883 RepID=A0ABQ2TZZ9_9ACTN|nr:SigE family RNA polymerase sigma factor [Streptomyces variabilis]GGP72713.1 DNA-directed RNA polymerase sigma-70 factor [Streptomyces griseoincarnatus]GGT58707.1 DNA-directed RNA polymerase sigma-70 factor [Streptomyces variabilis]
MTGAMGNSGSARDFETFVGACGPRLLRMAWLLTGDAHQAEDLLQTALAKVWPKWSRIAEEHPEAYVRKTLVTTHASWWRRRWRGEVPHGELPDQPSAGGDPFAAVDLEQSLAAAVRSLPRRQRAVLVLRYLEDLSVEETAQIMGCRPGTVKSQSVKALRTLRTALGDQHLDADGTESGSVPPPCTASGGQLRA